MRSAGFSKNEKWNKRRLEQPPGNSNSFSSILTVHPLGGLIKGRILYIIKWKDKIHQNFLCSTEFVIWQLCHLKEVNSISHADSINLRTIIPQSLTQGLLHCQQNDKWKQTPTSHLFLVKIYIPSNDPILYPTGSCKSKSLPWSLFISFLS